MAAVPAPAAARRAPAPRRPATESTLRHAGDVAGDIAPSLVYSAEQHDVWATLYARRRVRERRPCEAPILKKEERPVESPRAARDPRVFARDDGESVSRAYACDRGPWGGSRDSSYRRNNGG